MKKEAFVERANKIHNGLYKYDNLPQIVKVKNKYDILCHSCNSLFNQQLQSHLAGRGCPNCRGGIKLPLQFYIDKCRENNKDYSKIAFKDNGIEAKCNKCGNLIFKKNKNHIYTKGCKFCANMKMKQFKTKTLEDLSIPKGTKLLDYKGHSQKAVLYCIKHKCTYEQLPSYIGKKQGCKYCNSKLKDLDYFESRVDLDLWDTTDSVYKGAKSYITVKCKKCNHIQIKEAGSLMQRTAGCSKCSNSFNSSKEQKELSDWLSSYTDVQLSYRPKWMKGKELDIYLPKFNFAIEYNGVYWHSSHFKSRNYHKRKTDLCNANNVNLFHIWSDLWFKKKSLIKSMLLNKLGITPFVIGARKCNIRKVTMQDSFDFLNLNHLQGGNKGSIISYGLFYDNELLSIMTFRHRKDWELVKFATKTYTLVQGGFSKLLKYFIKEHSCKTLYSFIDRSWSLGNVYYRNGFKTIKTIRPDYVYISPNKINRFHKSILRQEEKNRQLNSYLKIYNSGLIKVIWRDSYGFS